MPLNPKMSASSMISELHKGPQYQRVKAKHGANIANKQAIAIALKEKRETPRAEKREKKTGDEL